MPRHQLQHQDPSVHCNEDLWEDCVTVPTIGWNIVGPATKRQAEQQMRELSEQYPHVKYRIVKLPKP